MDANKILKSDVLDILFENRNKDYGAYELRKTYNKRITKALLITASVALLALLGSLLANTIQANAKKVKKTEHTLVDIEQEEEKKVEPPPPPPPVEQPKVETQQFTPPVIKKDEEVKEEEKVEEVKEDVKIDVKTEEGVKDDVPTVVNIDEGKQVVEEKKEEDENHIFEKVEIEASFPGGQSAWGNYLRKNLRADVATENGAPAGTYTVNVRFVVGKDGQISDVRALTSHGYGLEEEAVRAIKKGPKWNPGNQNGRAVNSYHTQPITFSVVEE